MNWNGGSESWMSDNFVNLRNLSPLLLSAAWRCEFQSAEVQWHVTIEWLRIRTSVPADLVPFQIIFVFHETPVLQFSQLQPVGDSITQLHCPCYNLGFEEVNFPGWYLDEKIPRTFKNSSNVPQEMKADSVFPPHIYRYVDLSTYLKSTEEKSTYFSGSILEYMDIFEDLYSKSFKNQRDFAV